MTKNFRVFLTVWYICMSQGTGFLLGLHWHERSVAWRGFGLTIFALWIIRGVQTAVGSHGAMKKAEKIDATQPQPPMS